MRKRFIKPESRELAKQLHEEEHKIIDGKYPKDHRKLEWYYLMASGIFNNLKDKIESLNIELYNKVVDLEREIVGLRSSMKEVSKQQKYLWQTLEEQKLEEKK